MNFESKRKSNSNNWMLHADSACWLKSRDNTALCQGYKSGSDWLINLDNVVRLNTLALIVGQAEKPLFIDEFTDIETGSVYYWPCIYSIKLKSKWFVTLSKFYKIRK